MTDTTAPRDAARTSFLATVSYAHRGLHNSTGNPPENSLPAFAAALDRGFGIECDVRLSADGVAFVFHDERLDRLTTERGLFCKRRADELDDIRLAGDGRIPRLDALLALVAGRAPLLIELKVARGDGLGPLCAAVQSDLSAYRGPVAVMSFHPGVCAWFRTNAPDTIHGLIVSESRGKGLWGRIRRHLAMRAADPDFLAYDVRDLPTPLATRARDGGVPVLSWTVRTPAHWRTVRAHADAAIFEGEPEQGNG